MLSAGWAFACSQAFGELVFGILAHVVSVALALVARLAEVGVSPAEPLGDTTAELALEFNEILSVFGAVIDRDFAAVGANELLRVERSAPLGLVHRRHAVFSSSEVWILAFEALEIGVDGSCVLFRLPEVG